MEENYQDILDLIGRLELQLLVFYCNPNLKYQYWSIGESTYTDNLSLKIGISQLELQGLVKITTRIQKAVSPTLRTVINEVRTTLKGRNLIHYYLNSTPLKDQDSLYRTYYRNIPIQEDRNDK